MKLTDILKPECVKVPLSAVEKYQAITELIDLLDQNDLIKDYHTVLKVVMEREAVRSTGVGQGFAIPHGKCNGVDRLVMAVGKTVRPIEFESIDKQPVDLIVLLISPLDQTGPHIRAIAGISRIMADPKIRQNISESSTSDQLYQIIANHQQ